MEPPLVQVIPPASPTVNPSCTNEGSSQHLSKEQLQLIFELCEAVSNQHFLQDIINHRLDDLSTPSQAILLILVVHFFVILSPFVWSGDHLLLVLMVFDFLGRALNDLCMDFQIMAIQFLQALASAETQSTFVSFTNFFVILLMDFKVVLEYFNGPYYWLWFPLMAGQSLSTLADVLIKLRR